MSTGAIVGGVVGGILGLLFIIYILSGCYIVKEKEVVVIERLGKFKEILTAGIHWIWPCIDRPKIYAYRYVVDRNGRREVVESASNNYSISLQNEVLDFPKQHVITKDNACVSLDAVLSYQLITGNSARTMIYSVSNLPYVLGQLLQAHMRNVAATLDVDTIIEDSATMNVLTQLVNDSSMRWGVKVNFVKIQRVEANELTAVLGKKKTADLTNNNIIINAKSKKQTELLKAEGTRDSMIKTAEGQAQKKIAQAQGEASAIINAAKAEADALRKVIPALLERGEDPVKYFLNQKYADALTKALALPNTTINFLPEETAAVQVASALGLQAIPPYAVAPAPPLSLASSSTSSSSSSMTRR